MSLRSILKRNWEAKHGLLPAFSPRKGKVIVGAKSLPLVATAAPAKPKRAKRGPCGYIGKELTGKEREERKLSHGRTWSLCLHPQQPLGEAVCGCRGCGPSCKGYESKELR
jgi:hypothetical protein